MGNFFAGEKNGYGAKGSAGSIKLRFLLFSVVLLVTIFVGGSAAFFQSMRQIVRVNISHELIQSVEIQRINLEASVNGEIAIALKMADSPLIKRHFLNPTDAELKRIAFDEIEGYRQAFRSKTVFWASDIDMEFYFSEDNHYTIDPDDPDNYWYKMTLYETESFNFNINYNPEIQKIMLWINAPVFNASRKPVGLVGTGIDLSEFVDSIFRNFTNKGALYFFNSAGEITGAKDTNLIANKVTLDNELSETGSEILAWIGNTPSGIQTFSGRDGEIAVGPIPALSWYVAAVQTISLRDYLNTIMTVLFLAMMGLILVIFVIFNFSIRAFLRPLDGIIVILNQIAKDWDLMKRLKIHRKDEMGILANFFNQTFERIRELLYGIKGMTFSLAETGDELSANMNETGVAIDMISASIQEMSGKVLAQADEVNKAAGSVEKIITGLDELNNQITVQKESVEKSSSAIEQMLANIKSVTETLIRNSENIASLAESSGTGRDDLARVSTDIQEIAKDSEGLLEINSVMQSISSQTNLLAMNAAIEAAHAGESGRGFAVVADEIRKLAENSGKQSKTISAVLKKIKTSIDLITKSTAIVMEHFGDIEKEVETVSNQETQIRNAMEEQGIGSRHILEAIEQLNTVTGVVHQFSEEMTLESREVLKDSNKLKGISAEVAGSMDKMTGNVDQIVNAVIRVREISLENKQNIEELSREVAKFRVD